MTNLNTSELIVIGGGLAGTEASWQAAERGIKVTLIEMRPGKSTGAHTSSYLAELVCSNSLGSNLEDRAPGVLKNELRLMNSLLIRCAEKTAVPAGGALAVDRDKFGEMVTWEIENHPNIHIIREEKTDIPDQPTIVSSGPLTSPGLSETITKLTGSENLYFFDAISPIVEFDSINMDIAFRSSRYDRGVQEEGDYINCPLTKSEYENFVTALISAKRIQLKSFDEAVNSGVRAGMHNFFEACLPIEVLAMRGRDSLAYGPMRPVGLVDPRTGKRPSAILQLRQDNLTGDLYNLVGFQTNLTYQEQKRVFRLIPGLENAEFVRFGQMHRNTFITSPKLLRPTLQFHNRDSLFFAGQITGVEGYAGNIATGLIAGLNASRLLHHQNPLVFPTTTVIGSLCHYITHASPANFQPMKANFGILPPLEDINSRIGKRKRANLYAQRALEDLNLFLQTENLI